MCWFLDDWGKIKASFDNNKGEYPIQIEHRGNEVMVIKSGLQKTFTLKFSTEEWNKLRNLAEKIDAIYNMNKVAFYTWKTSEESAHRFFLSTMDCVCRRLF